MNARNCQLCGKPLSRLRVGGDGDFCSKEHRNQFRLRAGMDRLVEVNKVASLMRRRESPRQIPTASLIRSGAIERHEFANLLPQAVSSEPSLPALRPGTAKPRIAVSRGACVPQEPVPVAGKRQQPRTHGGGIPLVPGKSVPPRLRLNRAGGREALGRGEIRAWNGSGSDVPSQARDYSRLPAGAVRSHLGEISAGLRRGGRKLMATSAGVRELRLAAAEGANLRVSIGLAFRLPAVKQPARRELAKTVAALPRLERPCLPSGMEQDFPARERDLSLSMPEIAATLPAAPRATTAGALSGRPGLLPSQRVFRDMPASEARGGEVRWKTPAPAWHGTPVTQKGAGFGRRNGAHLFNLPLRARRMDAGPQEGAAPFAVREDVLVPTVPYFNVLAAATDPGDAPPEPSVSAPPEILDPKPVLAPPVESVRFEEHFDSGWDNWVGGVADWKVDVAGVRPGGLALYLPTLDLSDYDLEFLTRIDTRTVNWVVRATGANTHLHCTVTAVEGDLLEFSRIVVRDGNAEPAVASTMLMPGKPRRTFTVRMNVAGPVFSIAIDGKTIDTWVDDRLATGGIGFMSVPDDRARLYWVRVCSPGTGSKEQSIQ
ncbi:MAG: hypothetical protein JST11_12555 [Acidobacteria bacterium]|nr:hypothetical protein [Acidobacteriota bacterium]